MTSKAKLSPIQLIVIGFAVIILAGTLLLCLPISTRDGSISFIDAMFTAVSATCVTGLVMFDTYTKFTFFGQLVILILIQIGGLGFITLAMFVAMSSGRKIGLKNRTYLAEAVSLGQVGGVVKYSKMICIGTLIIEGAAAVLLSIRFVPMFGVSDGIWCGVFHAVSAFCNAGFDILGRIEPSSSLMYFASDYYVNAIITLLILTGGIGFFVWDDIREKKFSFRKYKLHTKIMLVSTAALIIVPTVLFMITEREGAFAGMSFHEKLTATFFQSVTLRTAGFNTTDYTAYSPAGYFLSILLMIVGAGAGSTGGGMKVTTFVVALLSIKAYVSGNDDINVFGRRLSQDTVKKASCSAAFYMIILMLGTYIIAAFSGADTSVSLFEAASALGTVGLSSGITGGLALIPKITVMLLMYIGRVGSISLAMSVAGVGKSGKVRLPEEMIIAG